MSMSEADLERIKELQRTVAGMIIKVDQIERMDLLRGQLLKEAEQEANALRESLAAAEKLADAVKAYLDETPQGSEYYMADALMMFRASLSTGEEAA